MTTGFQYTHEKGKPLGEHYEIDIDRAESLAMFLCSNDTLDGYEMSDALRLRLLPQIAEKFPGTIQCVQKFNDIKKPYTYTFPDGSKIDHLPSKENGWTFEPYQDSLSWMCATSAIMSDWEHMAYNARLLVLIEKADLPEQIKAYFLECYWKNPNARFDMYSLEKNNLKRENFKVSKDKTVTAYYITTDMEAWGNRSFYAYVNENGTIQVAQEYYSIGD